MPTNALLGREYADDPYSRIAPPEKFDVVDAGDLDDDQTVLLPFVARKIRCENAGDLAVLRRDGTIVVLPFAAGETQVLMVAKLLSTDTTVTGRITVGY
jgi:hypothetical protein